MASLPSCPKGSGEKVAQTIERTIPYKVVKKLSEMDYRIRSMQGGSKTLVFHFKDAVSI